MRKIIKEIYEKKKETELGGGRKIKEESEEENKDKKE